MTLYIDTKPTLEWIRPPANTGYMRNTEVWTAVTSHFTYEVHTVNLNTYHADYVYMHYRERIITNVTLSKAKAAAQADYERRTAERFKKVEVPDYSDMEPPYMTGITNYVSIGFNRCIKLIQDAITKATEVTSK
jgi:hypothetical protein